MHSFAIAASTVISRLSGQFGTQMQTEVSGYVKKSIYI